MSQYQVSTLAQSDIVNILSHYQAQFGIACRQRYQDLILTALEDIGAVPYRIGSSFRDEIAPGLRSFHLLHSRKRAANSEGVARKPQHVIFYRLADDQTIEVVRLVHETAEARLHLPKE
ncbi:type II toxin-antitoxin system RelE/ParE family toxin [Pseudomonas fluorescens]|uniref:type II toxin-antitoxin system RelE/ParE family toxin n=1 Tax=Pseudomonas fluorescens TaxID=294 RepID=UPI00177CB3D2|nr:type II toxin-antitoxin system RelE/ParE family toxin [Pseudomonas fluorescens]MBD8239473.1 type II toxin-antitoxin system RelE/ParE family toxin [Pseudomonas fluorescens]MDY0898481.1 type II toxin-antitoxin system RelE/ParE family toxin [Pseudomonas fluorescens]